MKKKIAINGFGRIGRLTLRRLLQNPDVEVVAINDLTDNHTLAHLFKYDTAQGPFQGDVSATDEAIVINGKAIKAYTQRNPADLPWAELGVDVVLECTGVFTTEEKAGLHLKAGAKRVVLSAPPKSEGIQTIVLGVNEHEIDPEQRIFSNASCTTNCLAPLVKIIDEKWGIERGFMTTTHAYTSTQRIQDAPEKDLRKARAAAANIIPTTTGAAKAVYLVYPKVKGKIDALALRVPVITGSLVEFNVMTEKDVTLEDVIATFKTKATGDLNGILEFVDAPIVSSDIIGNSHSSIFDAQMTRVSDKMIRLFSWYDNEAGYSARLADMCALVAVLQTPVPA